MINCRIIYNESCLKCDKVEGKMVRIGAFCMCQKCFEDEFDVADIKIDTKAGRKYIEWVEVYKDKT